MHLTKTKNKRSFLHDAVHIISMNTHSIESDDFHNCFQPISRHEMDSSGILYIFSFFIRYFILFPIRLLCLILSLLIYIILISRALYYDCENTMDCAYIFIIKALNFILGTRIKNYGTKEKLARSHIYVANHTSFIDFIILSSFRFPHACVSENHGGIFNMFFRLILGRNGSIAFKRSEKLDRSLVKEKMITHIKKNKLPMLIFPEGTCVNNKYTVLFQKGAFELDVDIVPVSIRYRRTLMDPYWNRKNHGFVLHLLYLMSRWYVEADVNWLPPIRKEENEEPNEFAERTRTMISKISNLKVTLWNGYLKSSPAIKDRDLLKVAFVKTYMSMKNKQYDSDLDLNDDSSVHYENAILFNKINYGNYLTEILRRYLSLKTIPLCEQELLISGLSTKSTVQLINKMKCSCKNAKGRTYKNGKYKIKKSNINTCKENV